MFKQNSKYWVTFLVLMFVLLVLGSIMNFYSFYEKKEGMKMIGGIVFGVMAIIYANDLCEVIKNKKSINSGA